MKTSPLVDFNSCPATIDEKQQEGEGEGMPLPNLQDIGEDVLLGSCS